MNEVIKTYQDQITKSKILKKLKLTEGKYLIVSLHREENVDDKVKLKEIIKQIISIQIKLKLKILVSTHPRTKINLKNLKLVQKNKLFKTIWFF